MLTPTPTTSVCSCRFQIWNITSSRHSNSSIILFRSDLCIDKPVSFYDHVYTRFYYHVESDKTLLQILSLNRIVQILSKSRLFSHKNILRLKNCFNCLENILMVWLLLLLLLMLLVSRPMYFWKITCISSLCSIFRFLL